MNYMQAMTCIEMAEELPEAEPCPVQVLFHGQPLTPAGNWLLYRTALAYLSGQLDDATTGPDVTDAADYGQSLFDMGLLTDEQVQGAVKTVFAAMQADCERRGEVLRPA